MSKPNSPKSPKSPKSPQSPKDAKAGTEKKALDLGELMQRLDDATAKTIEDYSVLFVTKYVTFESSSLFLIATAAK